MEPPFLVDFGGRDPGLELPPGVDQPLLGDVVPHRGAGGRLEHPAELRLADVKFPADCRYYLEFINY